MHPGLVRRVLLPILAWSVATALATWAMWAGVSFVGSEVTDRHMTIGAADVRAALGSAVDLTRLPVSQPVTTTTSPTTASSPARPSAASRPSPGAAGAPVATHDTHESATSSATSSEGDTRTESTKSFSSSGGFATVGCRDASIRLVSASPAAGYSMQVSDAGPEKVEVHFTSAGADSTIEAVCVNGQPALASDH